MESELFEFSRIEYYRIIWNLLEIRFSCFETENYLKYYSTNSKDFVDSIKFNSEKLNHCCNSCTPPEESN